MTTPWWADRRGFRLTFDRHATAFASSSAVANFDVAKSSRARPASFQNDESPFRQDTDYADAADDSLVRLSVSTPLVLSDKASEQLPQKPIDSCRESSSMAERRRLT